MRYTEILEACWTGYQQQGMKNKGGRQVPNCVPVEEVKIGPEITGKDLLFKAAAMAMRDAGREGINLDYEDAIQQAAKIYGIPYKPSQLPKLRAQLADLDARIEPLRQQQELKKQQKRQAKYGTVAAVPDQPQSTITPAVDRIKPPTRTLEETEAELAEDLKKWFKEKWVRFGPDGKIRGACARGSKKEGKPKCLPQSKAHALGKKGRAAAASKKRREDPNAERRGPAKNVATKVREQHDWDDADEFGMPGSEFFQDDNRLRDGDYVRDRQDGEHGEIFRMRGDPTERRVRILDRDGKGWYISPERLVAVDRTDPDIMKYFGRRRHRDMDEAGSPAQQAAIAIAMKKTGKKPKTTEGQLDEKCWPGYEKKGMKTMFGKRYPNCVKKESINETLAALDSDAVRRIQHMLNVKFDANLDVDGEMGPITVATVKKFLPAMKKSSAPDPARTTAVQGKEEKLAEKQDACYHKVKSRYKVWPSAYASGALVQCRKKGAANWGTGGKKK